MTDASSSSNWLSLTVPQLPGALRTSTRPLYSRVELVPFTKRMFMDSGIFTKKCGKEGGECKVLRQYKAFESKCEQNCEIVKTGRKLSKDLGELPFFHLWRCKFQLVKAGLVHSGQSSANSTDTKVNFILVTCTRLYTRPCRSVGWLIGQSPFAFSVFMVFA